MFASTVAQLLPHPVPRLTVLRSELQHHQCALSSAFAFIYSASCLVEVQLGFFFLIIRVPQVSWDPFFVFGYPSTSSIFVFFLSGHPSTSSICGIFSPLVSEYLFSDGL